MIRSIEGRTSFTDFPPREDGHPHVSGNSRYDRLVIRQGPATDEPREPTCRNPDDPERSSHVATTRPREDPLERRE
ncbi:MAG: hypothetical protein CMJ54_00575 [Planctomycetaceae bacterium]|nr:hypothetical protein [Planctomycetaceae bacterium]